jgi:hypothetical protein
MNLPTALEFIAGNMSRAAGIGLVMWAYARDGKSPTMNFLRTSSFPGPVQRKPLLGGMVEAWVIRNRAAPGQESSQ